MPRRAGPDNHRSGPHLLPVGKAKGSERRIADPANGERVPRCAICGLPSSSEMRGVWNGLIGRLAVCERDWFRYNPPDPLNVSEIA